MSGNMTTPPGHVKVKYVFKNGEFRGEVIEHGVGTSCTNENDALILAETDSMIGSQEESGLTPEGKFRRQEAPMANAPQSETPFGGGGGPFTPTDGGGGEDEKKRLDLGFDA